MVFCYEGRRGEGGNVGGLRIITAASVVAAAVKEGRRRGWRGEGGEERAETEKGRECGVVERIKWNTERKKKKKGEKEESEKKGKREREGGERVEKSKSGRGGGRKRRSYVCSAYRSDNRTNNNNDRTGEGRADALCKRHKFSIILSPSPGCRFDNSIERSGPGPPSLPTSITILLPYIGLLIGAPSPPPPDLELGMISCPARTGTHIPAIVYIKRWSSSSFDRESRHEDRHLSSLSRLSSCDVSGESFSLPYCAQTIALTYVALAYRYIRRQGCLTIDA